MTNTQKVIFNEGFLVEKFENEILLYTVADAKAVYLNESAYLVWSLCKEGLTASEICDNLSTIYPDQKDQILTDVTDALENFVKSGVVTLSDE